jgi:hypothetical protein
MVRERSSERLQRFLGMAVCGAAAAAAACSLSWRMFQDTPMLLYQSNLAVSHGMMPYRDFFYINLPGTFWFYGWVARLLGTSDFAVQFANLAMVALVAVLLFFSFPQAGRGWCAVFGISLGMLRLFSGEGIFVLQRETLAMIPIAALLIIGMRKPETAKGVLSGSAGVGFLLAGLALIKPQLALYGLPVVMAMVADCQNRGRRLAVVSLMGAGFGVPVAVCWVWLVCNGAWDGFCETVAYWPLYGQMDFNHTFLETGARLKGVLRGELRMIFSPYMAVAVLGLVAGWRTGTLSRRGVWLWGGVLALSVFVPALSGQFWGYHRLPFYFFTLCLAGYVLAWKKKGVVLCALLGAFWIVFAGARVWRETTAPSPTRLRHNMADQFADYLRKNLEPDECVQAIDWVSGAAHGMLMADALPATRFTETFYFLHNVDSPVIQKLRREFMDTLAKRPPQILLEARGVRWPDGKGTEARFEAFENWRDAHYRVAEETEHYRIWERVGDAKGV